MLVSRKGIEFIKRWESFKQVAYRDIAGIWTIGYGTIRYMNGNRVRPGEMITLELATTEMMFELEGVSRKLRTYISVAVNQNEFDAMVSLAYNIGTQGFRTSTLLRCLNDGKQIEKDYFMRWNKVTIDGQLIPSTGLTNRREAEWNIFRFNNYGESLLRA